MPVNDSCNIALVGPMGSGKTTVGKYLADSMGRQFSDSDGLIEESLGVSIPWIFDQEGEDGFRLRESRMLHQLLGVPGQIIATGGGIVTVDSNRHSLMASNCLTIYLKPDLNDLYRRLSNSENRPLLANADDKEAQIRALYVERDPLYLEVADITFLSTNISPYKQAQLLTKEIESCLNTQKSL